MPLLGLFNIRFIAFGVFTVTTEIENGLDVRELIRREPLRDLVNNGLPCRKPFHRRFERGITKVHHLDHTAAIVAGRMQAAPLLREPNDIVVREVKQVAFDSYESLRLAVALDGVERIREGIAPHFEARLQG